MNPFELPGPQFLVFFCLMGCVVLVGLVWVRRAWEPDPAMPVQLTDPYEIACLRGGSSEVLRLATAGLIDRGLLEVDGQRLKVTEKGIAELIRNPLERAILEYFRTGNDVSSMFAEASLRGQGEAFEVLLRQHCLVADKDARVRQLLIFSGAVGVLWVTAAIKIQLAIERGHPYSFLVILAILFTLGALSLAIVRKTRRGERFLKDMQTLFDPLRQRSPLLVANANSNELLMMGAVFGMSALPAATYPYVNKLFKPTQQKGGDGSVVDGGGCGSSHSGSCCGSSGGGSSCGGGGGCGGCGS